MSLLFESDIEVLIGSTQCGLLRSILPGWQLPRNWLQPHSTDLRHEYWSENLVRLLVFHNSCSSIDVDNSVLVDDAASMGDDLYIRDLCFSPDGKYLVTGGEDKRIRVCLGSHPRRLLFLKRQPPIRFGTFRRSTSGRSTKVTDRRSSLSIFHEMAGSSFQAPEIVQ